MNLDIPSFRPSFSAARVVEITEAAAAAFIGFQIAQLAWALMTPAGPLAPIATAESDRAARIEPLRSDFDPFLSPASASVGVDASQSEGGLVLFAVRVNVSGRGGSAIIGHAEEGQAAYEVGEAIAPGVILRAVASDHVVIERGGARRRLNFPLDSPTGIRPAAVNADVTTVFDGLPLRPSDAGGPGMIVTSSGGLLGQAGLVEGDIVTAIDGIELTPDRRDEVRGALTSGNPVEIRYSRGGRTLTTRLPAAGGR